MAVQILKKGQKPLNVIGGYREHDPIKDANVAPRKALIGGKASSPAKAIAASAPKGGSVEKPGLYANINAKKARIAAGSGEKMRKPGSKGAPSKMDFIKSARTAKPVKRSEGSGPKGEAVYEILGRRVTKEQYDEASKEMDRPKSKVEEDMDDFAKRAKERAKLKKMKTGGMVDKVGRAMKKPTADARGRAMRAAPRGR